jgi:hypothetical protein
MDGSNKNGKINKHKVMDICEYGLGEASPIMIFRGNS